MKLHRWLGLIFATAYFFSITPPQTHAAEIVVDEVTCTLIDAIIAANTDMPAGGCPAGNGADTIILDANVELSAPYGLSTDRFGGQAGLSDIVSDITIVARDGDTIRRINGPNSPYFRIFYQPSDAGTFTLEGITISGGFIQNPIDDEDGYGGAIMSYSTLVLRQATIADNTVQGGGPSAYQKEADVRGGALYIAGPTTIEDTIFRGNTAQGGYGEIGNSGFGYGGAIYCLGPSSAMTVMNSVFENNLAIGGITFHIAENGRGAIFNACSGLANHREHHLSGKHGTRWRWCQLLERLWRRWGDILSWCRNSHK